MTEESNLIKLTARSPAKNYEVEVDADCNVSQLKDKLLEQIPQVTKERICIIYTGKILKDNETLKQHKIGDKHVVHLVIRSGEKPASSQPSSTQSANTSNSTTANPQSESSGNGNAATNNTAPNANPFNLFSGMGGRMPQPADIMNNPELMRQMMNSPLIQNVMSNPDIMRSVLSSNPQFQQLMERNPEVGHLLNDPSIMRQTMEMMRNPNMLQEMMRNHDIAIRNLQGIPGGEAALERLYNDVQEPLLNSATNSLSGNPFATLRNNNQNEPRSNRAGQENNDALPNPWGPPPASSTNQSDESPNNSQGIPDMNNLMQQMMNDPNITSSLFNQQNMDAMRQSIQANPQVFEAIMNSHPAVQQNPNLRNSLRDHLPDLMNMMSNPQYMQSMQNARVVEALQQIHNGINTLRTEAPHLLGLFGPAAAGTANSEASTPGANPSSNSNAAPTNPMENLSSLLGSLGMNSGAQTAPGNPEQQYAAQLQQLEGMGFTNRAANIAALVSAFGDLNAAVERLLNSPR